MTGVGCLACTGSDVAFGLFVVFSPVQYRDFRNFDEQEMAEFTCTCKTNADPPNIQRRFHAMPLPLDLLCLTTLEGKEAPREGRAGEGTASFTSGANILVWEPANQACNHAPDQMCQLQMSWICLQAKYVMHDDI